MDFNKCASCECTTRRVKARTVTLIEGIDRCLLPEIQGLWGHEIKTVCSCCGHGDAEAAYIVADSADREKMAALGYEERPPQMKHCEKCGAFFKPKWEANNLV